MGLEKLEPKAWDGTLFYTFTNTILYLDTAKAAAVISRIAKMVLRKCSNILAGKLPWDLRS